ncbi:MAG: hypothetical protein ABWY25_07505 [Paenisporosarcina sp.]
MDYQGNTNKDKEPKPDKQIEKVVTGEVIQKPKSIGHKFKTIFFGGTLKNSVNYVTGDIVLPAIRDLVVDAIANGAKRMVYGESMYRRRVSEYRPRVSYNNPVYRGSPLAPRDPREIPRGNLPDQSRYRQERREANDLIIPSREEAELVLERLIDIIDKYDAASLADLYDLMGLPTSPIDNKWGWTSLGKVEVRQVREGYVIDLPELESM